MHNTSSPILQEESEILALASRMVANARERLLRHLAALVEDLSPASQKVYFCHYKGLTNLHLTAGNYEGRDLLGLRVMPVQDQSGQTESQLVGMLNYRDLFVVSSEPDQVLLAIVAYVQQFYDDSEADCLKK